jgi:4-amino-4-deoxy-L-arabinose transferase-like glycosyltransferase
LDISANKAAKRPFMPNEIPLRQRLRQILCSVAFIVVVAFAVRTAFVCYFFITAAQRAVRENLPFGYEAGAIAAAIAQGRGFSSPLRLVQTGPTVWFTPIYPYLLAGIFKLFGVYSYTSNILIRFLDNIFSACTCWPIYAIGAKAFGKRVGAAAAWIWVFFPMSLFFSTVWVWDTALSALMLALIVAATFNLRGSERLSSWIGYGALWAVGSMVNPGVVSALPPLALWALWPLRRRFATAGRLVLASSLIFAAGIMPWTVRNYVVFHKFIPFRSNFGLELWLGNNPAVPDSWSPWLHPDDDPSEAAKYARMTEIPYMQEKQQEAVRFIRTHPLDTLNFTLHRFSNNWLGMDQSPSDLWNHVPLQVKLIIVGNCVFPLLSLLGALFAYREHNEVALPLALVMLFFPLVFYITHASTRYRHPMDPIMLVLAVYALAYPVTYLLKRFSDLEARIPATHTTD